jgi:DNA topoisomerase-1
MKLLIVESPAKAKTISKYLKGEYAVKASVGHIRDLPKSNNRALDIEGGFVPRYEIVKGKEKVVSEIKKLVLKADEVVLATDPDREGEAIAWHIAEAVGLKNPKRVVFHEITQSAIESAMKNPRPIDINLKESQEARRVLDRIVGYDLSGLIWKKLRYGLSAGRVQSPALRIIVEREREIRAFKPETYFVVRALVKKRGEKGNEFELVATKRLSKESDVEFLLDYAKKNEWVIDAIETREVSRAPSAPFRTSTLQQAASSRLGFAPARTMSLAQRLYEAGHITYMRTDSTVLSSQAVAQARAVIASTYGKEYIGKGIRARAVAGAQEAHEGIRPTNFSRVAAGNTEAERRLYDLIRTRSLASQMANAKVLSVKIVARVGKDSSIPRFSASGSRVLFPGWYAADPLSRADDVALPSVKEKEALDLIEITSDKKQTEPPARYSEARLIQELEKRGIGRPSTYASIIKTILDRGYVVKEQRSLKPTETGEVVSEFLEKNFGEYVSDSFTSEMESKLDCIAGGTMSYKKTLSDFYGQFSRDVANKQSIEKINNLGSAPDTFACPECGSAMVVKLGKTGKFLSCSRFPECSGALTMSGEKAVNGASLGIDPETGEKVYVFEGRFGPYVQRGESPAIPKRTTFPKGHKKTPEEKELVRKEKEAIAQAKLLPKPRRASIPPPLKAKTITLDEALHLLKLPRELGLDPESGEAVIANIGRFGPYVGRGREFRSIKKKSGLDPYTITLEEALTLLSEEKPLPKGVTLARAVGKHPKTGKDIRILKSRSGFYIQKGLKRVYLDDKREPNSYTLDEIVALLG